MDRTALKQQRGLALLSVLVSIFAVAGLVLSYAAMEFARSARTVSDADRSRAFVLAEGGLEHGAALLRAGAWTGANALDWSTDGIDNDGDALVDEGDETVAASATFWGIDGADNDLDGAVDEEDEQVVRVEAQARVGRVAESVTGWFRKLANPLVVPPAAIYLDDPFAILKFNGNAFHVDGNDTNLDGSPGPADPVYGISINGDPNDVVSQLGAVQTDNVTGMGGAPSVGDWNPGDPLFIDAMIAEFSPLATQVFQNYSGTYTGELGNASTGQFEVTYSQGSLQLGGGSQGAGILLVEGNLVISGGWTYIGYVFVTGRVIFQGGGGDSTLMGALFVGGDVLEPSTNPMQGLTLSGNIDILYSTEALNLVEAAFSKYRLLAVSEP